MPYLCLPYFPYLSLPLLPLFHLSLLPHLPEGWAASPPLCASSHSHLESSTLGLCAPAVNPFDGKSRLFSRPSTTLRPSLDCRTLLRRSRAMRRSGRSGGGIARWCCGRTVRLFLFLPLLDPPFTHPQSIVTASGLYYRSLYPPHPPYDAFVEDLKTDTTLNWIKSYFQLDTPLEPLYDQWAAGDARFKKKVESAGEGLRGIRVLKQDEWETLVSCVFFSFPSFPHTKRRLTMLLLQIYLLCQQQHRPHHLDGQSSLRLTRHSPPSPVLLLPLDSLHLSLDPPLLLHHPSSISSSRPNRPLLLLFPPSLRPHRPFNRAPSPPTRIRLPRLFHSLHCRHTHRFLHRRWRHAGRVSEWIEEGGVCEGWKRRDRGGEGAIDQVQGSGKEGW